MADVVLLRWPEERDRSKELLASGVALLYLVADDADPPCLTTCLEDWARIPGDDRDLRARVENLQRRAEQHALPPYVDEQGRFHHHGSLIALAPTEARLANALTEHFDEVVSDHELVERAGFTTTPKVALQSHMTRLRARLRPARLVVKRVRGRGYVLRAR
jgi:DNA-binding response OmpR family regulator